MHFLYNKNSTLYLKEENPSNYKINKIITDSFLSLKDIMIEHS
jgi:hypothetical protein